eukprot:2725385-Ditylum_brightwellii.AAC.1
MKEDFPSLACWQDSKTPSKFTMSSIYHLMSMIYYIGLVCLLCLCNYWGKDLYMPQHRVMKELSMTRTSSSFCDAISMSMMRKAWDQGDVDVSDEKYSIDKYEEEKCGGHKEDS